MEQIHHMKVALQIVQAKKLMVNNTTSRFMQNIMLYSCNVYKIVVNFYIVWENHWDKIFVSVLN